MKALVKRGTRHGRQEHDVLSQRQPPAQFMFVAGYMGWRPWERIVASNMPILRKPFRPTEWVVKIREMLRT